MKVLVAGATGAIGHPLMSALVAAGHQAIGMTSTERGLRTLKELGAERVMADALDAAAVDAAFRHIRPDAVIDELTSLPKHYTPDEMRVAAERDRRVRLEGGRNIFDAARAVGARRYVVQSTGFFYPPLWLLLRAGHLVHRRRGHRAPGSWLPAFADAIGAPAPPRLSEAEALEHFGPDFLYYASRLRGASNAKAKQQMGFAPRQLEWLAVRR